MSDVKIYQIGGDSEISVTIDNDAVWLNLNHLVDLFGRDKILILSRDSVVAKNATTATDGKKYVVDYYSLDVIISIGYRVKSKRGTQFRIWANKILREYLIQGYVVNQQALKKKSEKLSELQDTVRIVRDSDPLPLTATA